jgi:hypothetical protein
MDSFTEGVDLEACEQGNLRTRKLANKETRDEGGIMRSLAAFTLVAIGKEGLTSLLPLT